MTTYEFYAALIANPEALPPFSLYGRAAIIHFPDREDP